MDPTPTTPAPKRIRSKSSATTTPAVTIKAKATTPTVASRASKKALPAVKVLTIPPKVSIDSNELQSRIATAAYLRAAARNFAPGNDMDDWLAAEREVLAELS